MPLPVERSQGSVSALVARFQTAADRDKEVQAREAGRGPRLSGTVSRRTSNYGVPSVGDVQLAPVSKSSSADQRDEPNGSLAGKEAGSKKETEVEEVLQDLKLEDEAATESPASNGVEEPPARRPFSGSGASLPGAPTEKQEPVEVVTPPKPTTASKSKTTPSPVNAKASSGITATSKSPATKTAPNKSLPSPIASRTPVRNPQPIPGSSAKAGPSQTSPTTKKTPAPSQPPSTLTKASTPAPTDTPTKTKTTTATTTNKTTPSARRPSGASTTSSRRLPSSTTSATSRSPATPLVPAMTGPAASRPTPGSAQGPIPAPLKPHLTGTPAMPTASFLAKQRTASISQSPESPEKKRQSLSLGRASGSRLSGVYGRAGSASPSAPFTAGKRDVTTPSKPPTSTSGTSSRLLQGTAASRARAAAASPKVEPKDKPKSTPSGISARAASTSPTTAKTPGLTPIRMPPVGKSPIGRVGLAGAREKPKAGLAQTPAVGLSPIGRQGVAEAREKKPANGDEPNGVDHSTQNGETSPAEPVVEPTMVATPDGPVGETGSHGCEEME